MSDNPSRVIVTEFEMSTVAMMRLMFQVLLASVPVLFVITVVSFLLTLAFRFASSILP